MFWVIPDHAHGLVAAPRSDADVDPLTEQSLNDEGFTWHSEIEAFTRPNDSSPEAVDRTALILRELGHFVFSSWTPRPTR